MSKTKIVIVGGGTSALAVAGFLDNDKFDVHLYEKNKAIGRKFLVAGKGGFNLTHSEVVPQLINKYRPEGFLDNAITNFNNFDLREYLELIGVPTFIGSSGRIFPMKGIKPIEVLEALNNLLFTKNVTCHFGQLWKGFSEESKLLFNESDIVEFDYAMFALGGASWSVTGSDGTWLRFFKEIGITTKEFESSNSGITIDYPGELIPKIEGKPLKNISVSSGDMTMKGEIMITDYGMEGSTIYALNHNIRHSLNKTNSAHIEIDLKPGFSFDNLMKKFRFSSPKNHSDFLKDKIKLSSTAINLLKAFTSKEEFLDPYSLITSVKHLQLKVKGLRPIDEAISTVGGISVEELGEQFQLISQPNIFILGEMSDWDAPTGGYLIQACFSMAKYVADYLNNVNND